MQISMGPKESNTGKFPIRIGDVVEIIGWEERYHGFRFTVERLSGENGEIIVCPDKGTVIRLIEMADPDWGELFSSDGECGWWEGFLYNHGPASLENE